jgi:hypothetical protein
MLGKAAVAMWWDISADVRADWEEWHTYEHMPERLGIPGFLRGSRWIGVADEGTYFVLYETAELDTVMTGAYLERLNNPTSWSRQMMPHHRNMVRSLCAVRAYHGHGLGRFMGTVRFSGPLPSLPKARGITSAALLESQPMQGGPTAEQKMRGGVDPSADKVLLVGGYDGPAVQRVANELGLPGAVAALYRLSYTLT